MRIPPRVRGLGVQNGFCTSKPRFPGAFGAHQTPLGTGQKTRHASRVESKYRVWCHGKGVTNLEIAQRGGDLRSPAVFHAWFRV